MTRDTVILRNSFFLALALELTILFFIGWQGHWLAHPQTANNLDQFIEAQIFQVPQDAHLTDATKKAPAPVKHEVTLSKIPGVGQKAKINSSKPEEENQTQSGAQYEPTHGPVAIYSPSPAIPAYMQDKDLKTSVVIDFFVSSLGVTTPKLVGSSGNEELDAIAINTARKWQFRPAENNHHPIDSKVRLRIVFEVK